MLRGPEHRTAQRVIAKRGLVDQVLGHHRGLIVGPCDLLDDDTALAVELVPVDSWPPDEVGAEVCRLERLVRAHGDVEGDEVVARVSVEDRADPLGRLVDVTVGGVLLTALEHEMLEEVGHPVLVLALGARAGVERDEDGGRTRALPRDPVEGQPVAKACVGTRSLTGPGRVRRSLWPAFAHKTESKAGAGKPQWPSPPRATPAQPQPALRPHQ